MLKLGEYGSVDYVAGAVVVSAGYAQDGIGNAKLEVSINALDLLRMLVKKTATPLDDAAVEMLAAALAKGA